MSDKRKTEEAVMMEGTRDELEYFGKAIRVAMLGESSLIPQHKVIGLCRRFFLLGIDRGLKRRETDEYRKQ